MYLGPIEPERLLCPRLVRRLQSLQAFDRRELCDVFVARRQFGKTFALRSAVPFDEDPDVGGRVSNIVPDTYDLIERTQQGFAFLAQR